jgi:hypothetical protein
MNDQWLTAQKLAHLIGTHSRQQKIDADFLPIANTAMQKIGTVSASCCGRERI